MAADPITSTTVDDLLNFDSTDDEGLFKDKPSGRRDRDDKPTLSPRGSSKRKAEDDDDLDAKLGLTSEVQIKKKRKPIAKLDEARLLSAPGIPKLRADARYGKLTKKLRLKGKGHEFSDVARLLSYYQLWLDDLYPRAKFADGLQLVEKAGHSRRMQLMRKEWIDEGKPGYIREKEAQKKSAKEEQKTDEMYAGDEALMSGSNNEPSFIGNAAEDDSLFVPDSRPSKNNEEGDTGLPEDDELDALLAEQETRTSSRPTSAPKKVVEEDSEGEDDLEALLAEQESRRAPASATAPSAPSKQTDSIFNEDEDEDMDDLDALLTEQATRSRPSSGSNTSSGQPTAVKTQQSASPNEEEDLIEDDDELDALFAEQEARQEVVTKPTVPVPTSAEKSCATPVAVEKEMLDDGADMFSSSPVRGTATSRFDQNEDREGVLPVATQMRKEAEEDNHEVMAQHTVPAAAEREKEEESQGVDAGDMFSSSPMQNE